MATLREITSGTGYQNGGENVAISRWTYRGYTTAGSARGLDGSTLTADITNSWINAAGTHYIWFSYTGPDVAETQDAIRRWFQLLSQPDYQNTFSEFQLIANNVAGNRIGHLNVDSAVNRGYHGLEIVPIRGNVAGNNAQVTFALRKSPLSPTDAREANIFFDEIIRFPALVNGWDMIDPTEGYQDFNFDLPTYVHNNHTVTGDVIVDTDYVDGDPMFNFLTGESAGTIYKSGLYLERFNSATTVDAQGNKPISNETDRSNDRVLAVNQDGEVVLAPAQDQIQDFGDNFFIEQTTGHLPIPIGTLPTTGGRISLNVESGRTMDWKVGMTGYAYNRLNGSSDLVADSMVVELVITQVTGTDVDADITRIIRNPQGLTAFPANVGSNNDGLILLAFDPSPVGETLSVTEEGSSPVTGVDNIIFDSRHFSVTTTSAGDPEVTFNASVLGGAEVEGRNALGNTITASDPATIALRNGLVSVIANPGSATETITVDAKPRTFVLPGTTSISPELFAVNFIGASTALGNRAMPANPTDGDWFEVSNPFSRGTVTLVTSATTGVHFDGDTSSTEYAITSDIENVRFTYSTKSVDGATQARWITATTTRSPRKYKHTQGTAAIQWDVEHNLNEMHPAITVWDNTGIGEVVIPDQIIAVNANNLTIHFPVAVAGRATMIG